MTPSNSSPEFPIYRDLRLCIAVPQEGVYALSIANTTGALFSKVVKTAPWRSTKVQVDFASQASEQIPTADKQEREIFKTRLLEAFRVVTETVETNDDVRRGLTPPDIRRVIAATTHVDIYPGHQSEYRVTLENGEHLSLTPAEISGGGRALRVKWLNAYPREMLHITIMGFREIVNYWTEQATEHERETTTDFDSTIEQLQEHLQL